MKIYICDIGWAGCLFAIASDIESARLAMEKEDDYSLAGEEILSFPISEGFVYQSYGDR